MCQISNIRLLVSILSWLKGVLALYIFGIGIYFANTVQLHQGFGKEFISFGVGFIFLAIISAAVVFPHQYAIKRHNRFLLLVCFFIDTLVFSLLISTSYNALVYTVPVFPKDLQQDCLAFTPTKYNDEQCRPFLQSDRTAGFRLFWEGYYTDKKNTASFQVLSTIQGDICCGFFAPMRCIENGDSFPSEFAQTGIRSDFLKQRVECGNMPGYYPQQDVCLTYYDQAAVPPIIGGCNYDLGVSYCLTKEIIATTIGCASSVEDYMAGLVAPHCIVIMMLSGFNFLAMLLACCMWWKRKEYDVFPAFTTDIENAVNFHEIKDQFEVKPMPNILAKEGYIDVKAQEVEIPST